jgi:hypothetical protein
MRERLAHTIASDAKRNYSGKLGLSRSDQKYFPKSGMASFWTHNKGAVELKETALTQDDIDTSNVLMTEFRHPSGTIRGCNCTEVGAILVVWLVPRNSLSRRPCPKFHQILYQFRFSNFQTKGVL